MSDNIQNLPAGLAGRVNAATAPAPVAPALPHVAPVDRGPAVPVPAPVAAPTAPAELPVNPMLSSGSQPKPDVPTEPAPAPVAPAELPKPAEAEKPAPVGSVAELAGALAQDAVIAPAVSYLDAICKDEGLDVARAFGNAADELDARFLDRAYLTEKLGAEKAETIIKIATDTIAYVAQYTDESLQQVYKTAGGEDQFRAAAAAFNEKADPTEKAMLVDMLNSGDRKKMQYAATKISEFAAQAGAIVRHNAPPLGQPGTQQGLSREAYAKAIQQRNLSDAQYAQLKALRRLGMDQGL